MKEYYVSVMFPPSNEPQYMPPVPRSRGAEKVPAWGEQEMLPVPATKSYTYVGTLTDDEVVRITNGGAFVIVESPATSMTLAWAQGVSDLDYSSFAGPYKQIVQVIDTGPYELRKERMLRRVALKKHIDRMADEARANLDLQTLLGGNAEAQAMIEELKTLQS